MNCGFCGKPIHSWYFVYKGKFFCEKDNSKCIKEYLYMEHDSEITEDRTDGEIDYNMGVINS